MRYLLDTEIVAEMRKIRPGRADPGLAGWAATVPVPSLFLSAISLHELEMGVLRKEREDSAEGTRLRSWLVGQVLPAFSGRILAVDGQVTRLCARLHVPETRPFRDSLLAATALRHGLTLVTRHESEFAPMGVPLLNPFS